MIKKVILDGEWRLKHASGVRGGFIYWPDVQEQVPDYPATVPGSVYDAMKFVTGDTNLGHNSLAAQWIENEKWCYTRYITLSEDDIKGKLRVVFEGLDLTAKIYINGTIAGEHNNFYTPCKLDITSLVKAGENKIDVVIDSGLCYGVSKPEIQLHGSDNPANLTTRRMWLRKPQSSAEWDWSPRLLGVGIYKSCYIEITDGIFVDETAIIGDVNDDYSKGSVRIRQFLDNLGFEGDVCVKARIAETGAEKVFEGKIENGKQCVEINIDIDNPKLWYPRGYGEQNLYTVEIEVSHGDKMETFSKKTGIRRIVIDQSKHPVEGYYFNLIVNGEKVFCKGANMVPADTVYSRLTRDVYETIFERAIEANFTMLRVWGGGIYETDDFYELCDEHGILVWQDFIAACASYPGYDNEFFANYQSEIRYQIRRLSRFASLAIYAGNNEILWWHEALEGEYHYPDAQLYHWYLPRWLREEGDTHYYQPTSPYSFDFSDCDCETVGDQHPWTVGFEDRDYFKYRDSLCRFANEGGMLGPTSLPNMMMCFSEGQDYMHSFDWEHHDNSVSHWIDGSPDLMLKERFGMSCDGMSIADYTYYGGFCQGEGFTEYILNFRRRMYDSCAAIFWMFNDCWPATRSWTIVDYLRNRTPSFYPVKRSFEPIAVDIVKTQNGFDVYGINERLYEVSAELEYGVFTPDGEYNKQHSTVKIPANSSVVIAHINAEEGYIPYAELKAEGEPLSRRRYVDKAYNELGLKKCEIKVEKRGNKAVYTADKLVLGVCIDLDGDKKLGDNFFDLYPGKPYEVEIGEHDGSVLYAYQGE